MQGFQNHFNTVTGKENIQLDKILPFFSKMSVQRGEILLRPDETVSHAWNINSGILRAYYYLEEQKHTWKNGVESGIREITPWITPAPGFLTDIPGFLLNRPSTLYIEALEDCELFSLSQENYRSLQIEFPEVARFIFERSLIMSDCRVRMLNLRHPIDRLLKTENMYPGITARVSVNIIASYINVDPSTLSKMRRKKNKFDFSDLNQ